MAIVLFNRVSGLKNNFENRRLKIERLAEILKFFNYFVLQHYLKDYRVLMKGINSW